MAMSVFNTLIEKAPTISVGLLTADLMNLGSELERLEKAPVDFLHFDVMDGCFTPMMTVGPPYVKGVKTRLFKDVHLMVQEPLEKVGSYVDAGADIVSIHVESCVHVHRVLQYLGQLENVTDPSRGLVRGVALNPGTSLSVLEPLLDELEMVTLVAINPGWGGQSFLENTFSRLAEVRRMIEQSRRTIALCVDGGITRDNIARMAGAGVDLVVTGSAVFDGKAPLDNANYMLGSLRSKPQM